MNITAQLLVVTDKIMNYRGNTALFLPLLRGYSKFFTITRYYREIFPIYRGTVELPLSPLQCHSLVRTTYCAL